MQSPVDTHIGVIGLGYVGLPLAAVFATEFDVVGFDVNPDRVKELQAGRDHNAETDPAALRNPRLTFTADPDDLADCTFFIVAVPSPVNDSHEPNLDCLRRASATVGRLVRRGDCVVFESTVYPGVTESICLPIIEQESGLRLGDFQLGYSPERVNPGDKQRPIEQIVKIVSGGDEATLQRVAQVYGRVIKAGVHRAPTIQTAEAAKVIENVQRDLNIALMNELSKIFAHMNLNTKDVLDAAATKWNFHRYHPGLVGGHCIGVDPYYLTHKAQAVGHHPEMILAGRRVNDGMGAHIADATVRAMVRKGINPVGARVLLMGLTFKENCPDLRNTRVIDIHATLSSYNTEVAVYDPWVDPQEAEEEYGIRPLSRPPEGGSCDAIIIAVPHRQFIEMGIQAVRALGRPGAVVFDVKSIFPRDATDLRL